MLLLIELLQQVQKKLRTDDQIALPPAHIGERGVNVEQVKVVGLDAEMGMLRVVVTGRTWIALGVELFHKGGEILLPSRDTGQSFR